MANTTKPKRTRVDHLGIGQHVKLEGFSKTYEVTNLHKLDVLTINLHLKTNKGVKFFRTFRPWVELEVI